MTDVMTDVMIDAANVVMTDAMTEETRDVVNVATTDVMTDVTIVEKVAMTDVMTEEATEEMTEEMTAEVIDCQFRIQSFLNKNHKVKNKKTLEAIPQVEKAEVSHTENRAVVTLKEEVPFSVLKEAVEAQDYEVVS